MHVRDAGEALYIACEMEKRAIRLYERALVVFADGPCQEAIRAIVHDERRHLRQFEALGPHSPEMEKAQLLSAQAAEALFPGGLMEAQRRGAFESARALYAYAAAEEKTAIERYGDFAARFQGEIAQAFHAIVLEEKQHYARFLALEKEQQEK